MTNNGDSRETLDESASSNGKEPVGWTTVESRSSQAAPVALPPPTDQTAPVQVEAETTEEIQKLAG